MRKYLIVFFSLLALDLSSTAQAFETLKEGQIWITPVERPDQVLSLIQKIEKRNGVNIIHVTPLTLSPDTLETFVLIKHVPMTETAFRNSVTELFMSSAVDPHIFERNYKIWNAIDSEVIDAELTEIVKIFAEASRQLSIPISDLYFSKQGASARIEWEH